MALGAARQLSGDDALSLIESTDTVGWQTLNQRVVRDRNHVNGENITYDVDFALIAVAGIEGPEVAKRRQPHREYDNVRPFTDRSPRTVAVEQPQKVQEQIVPLLNKYVWRHNYGKTDQ